jgi:transcriptional regulator with XRE-family HTH domain
MSQEVLAARAGLHPTHISLIETGKRIIRLTTVKQLALALNVQPAELMPPIVLDS